MKKTSLICGQIGTKPLLATVALIILLAGCASPSSAIRAQHDPNLERKYKCQDVADRASVVNGEIQELGKRLDRRAETDKIKAAAGVLFFPLWFTIEGNKGPDADEFARLKGERDILQRRFKNLRCTDFPEFSDN